MTKREEFPIIEPHLSKTFFRFERYGL